MKIALDAMGGDLGLDATVAGAAAFVQQSDTTVVLVGDPDRIKPLCKLYNTERLECVPAQEVIGMDEHPVQAVRQKTDASVVVGANLVREGRAQALVSAGNTGAAMTAALLRMGRLPGIERPAIAIPLPTEKGMAILVDAGANVDCRPRHLIQFAAMGRAYMKNVWHIPDPAIGLLNIGEEPTKGNDLTLRVYPVLESLGWNFIGNIEGRDLFTGKADVIVCDGFVGNVVLKVAEGLGITFFALLKKEISRNWLSHLGALLARDSFRRVKKQIDYVEYGGAPLLGVNGVMIICHGSSDARAITNALRVAREAVETGLKEAIATTLAELGGEQ